MPNMRICTICGETFDFDIDGFIRIEGEELGIACSMKCVGKEVIKDMIAKGLLPHGFKDIDIIECHPQPQPQPHPQQTKGMLFNIHNLN